jgi:tetratricopeptide (TPR) repeat protein
MECGDLERARELNQRAAEGGRKRGDHESFANAELNLGDIALLEGDLALARDYLEGVLRLVRDPSTSEWMRWRYSMHLFASLGELALARGDSDTARGHADECLERATRTRSRKYIVKSWRLRGELALARRHGDDAEHALRQALEVAQSIDNPTELWKTHAALGRLYAALRLPEASSKAYRSAVKVVDRIKASVDDPKLAETLATAPRFRELYQHAGPE